MISNNENYLKNILCKTLTRLRRPTSRKNSGIFPELQKKKFNFPLVHIPTVQYK